MLWKNVLQYSYHFLESLIVVFTLVLFTSYQRYRLSQANSYLILSILSVVVVRSFYQYGVIIDFQPLKELGEYLFLIPALFLLLSVEFRFQEGEMVCVSGREEDKLALENSGKAVLALILGIIALMLFMKKYLSIFTMIAVVMALMIYYIMNQALKQTIKAEISLREEEKKRKNLEEEINRRTGELKQKNDELRDKNDELKEKNELLGDLIYFDMNLGLYTIRYLQEYLEIWNKEYALSLFVVDIRGFKNINSLFNYSTGDEVLKTIAERLKETYSHAAVIFRFNSDKFGVLFLKDLSHLEVLTIIREIHEMGEKTIQVDGINIHVKFSIGVASYERNAKDIQRILSNAEYAEREAHRMITEKSYQIFDREIELKIEREKQIQRLLEVIDFDTEFSLFYQPQCDTSGKLVGMEALIRWYSADLGFVSPGEFIPIAENSSAILKIVKWTLRKGIQQIKEWNGKYGTDYSLGINISTKFIENTSFLNYVEKLILEYGIPAKWVDLEITETSLMNMSKDIISLFTDLSDLGVSISIDDFGTGYSSLGYISAFDVDTIKIARELVIGITESEKDRMLVKAIIMMANSLNLKVLAEGVEEKEQLDILSELGCSAIQGYYFGKPQNTEDFERNFLKNKDVE